MVRLYDNHSKVNRAAAATSSCSNLCFWNRTRDHTRGTTALAEAIKGAAAVSLRQRTKFVARMQEKRYGRCWKRNKGDAIGYRLWLSRATMVASIAIKAA